MKKDRNHSRGFTLLELMIVIGIISILASIGLPHYMAYIERARATVCLSNRHEIEKEQHGEALTHDTDFLPKIDERWKCPSGGIYAWVQDPGDPERLTVVCSIHGGEGPQKPNELFSSKFENMESLTPLIGRWKIKDGALVPKRGGEHRLAFGDKDWKDYEIKTNVTLSKGMCYGVYYRTDGKRDISGYIFQYDPDYRKSFLVRKVDKGGEKSPFQRVKMPDNFSIYNKSHDITITVEKDHHVIRVDGEVVFDFQDDTFLSGMPGFRTWGHSNVSFHDVVVYGLQ